MGSIKAVRKYENPIEFPETHKLWMDTNSKPTIQNADDQATFNRLHPIPFVVAIPKEQVDINLPAALLAEAEGILAWAVQGATEWHQSGLNPPPEVTAARQRWRDEEDQLGRFLAEACVTGERVFVYASDLYKAYKAWAEQTGEKETDILKSTPFGKRMTAKFKKEKEDASGKNMYYGIGLKTERNQE